MPRQSIIDDKAAQIAWLYLRGGFRKKDSSVVREIAYYVCGKRRIAKIMLFEIAYRVGYSNSKLSDDMSETSYKKKKKRLRDKLVSTFMFDERSENGKS